MKPASKARTAAVEPKMDDICANCRMRYGRHQLVGDWCPSRKRGRLFADTRWKAKK